VTALKESDATLRLLKLLAANRGPGFDLSYLQAAGLKGQCQIACAQAIRQVIVHREGSVLPTLCGSRQLGVEAGGIGETSDALTLTQYGDRPAVIAKRLPGHAVAHAPKSMGDGLASPFGQLLACQQTLRLANIIEGQRLRSGEFAQSALRIGDRVAQLARDGLDCKDPSKETLLQVMEVRGR
jgi:hypothetical protein